MNVISLKPPTIRQERKSPQRHPVDPLRVDPARDAPTCGLININRWISVRGIKAEKIFDNPLTERVNLTLASELLYGSTKNKLISIDVFLIVSMFDKLKSIDDYSVTLQSVTFADTRCNSSRKTRYVKRGNTGFSITPRFIRPGRAGNRRGCFSATRLLRKTRVYLF